VGDVTEGEVHAAFTQAFNGWVGEKGWAVLRFDTAEFLEYGQDEPEVLEECEVFGEEVPSFTWLQEHLPALERATALVAARPTHNLRQQLESACKDLCVSLPLKTLSLEETSQYFQASEYGKEIEEEMVERIWLLADGRPILLSLAIDWLSRGVRVDEIYDADTQELYLLKGQMDEEWKKRQQRFEAALVGKMRLLSTPEDAALYYAARARKGFTVGMLRRMLAEISPRRIELAPEEAGDLVQSLAKLSFVKHPHGARPGWFFLHDEMYDLLDRHVWQSDYPTYTHQAETARFLAKQIYGEEDGEGLVAEAAEQVSAAETHLDLLEARRGLEILRTEQLFYWLEADPLAGYRLYDRWDTQAVSQRRHEWDDTLRIELLRFIRTLPEQARLGGLVEGIDPQSGEPIIADFVNRDCRGRWVHRFSARGNPSKTERIARRLMDIYPDWGGIWKAGVLVGLGAALVRMGYPESTDVFQKALQILEQPQLEGDPWVIRHYIATAYLYLGLQARAEWDLKRAAEMNEKARYLFRENDEPVGDARVSSNLAYVWALQGKYADAIEAARKAVDARRELGDVVGAGLSLNTLAIAEDLAGTHARARVHAQEALSLLRRARQMGRPGLDREAAMVYLNLGRIERHLVERTVLRESELFEKAWQRAKTYLEKVLEREASLEPYYRFQLYNQLGVLRTRWANWVAITISGGKDQYRDLMERANDAFERADQYSREKGFRVNRADNLEDWAWMFHLRRSFAEMMEDELEPAALGRKVLECLQEADNLIQDEADPRREGLLAHYVAGNVHHQWGRYIHKFEGDIGAALQQYAISTAYYDQFSSGPIRRRDLVVGHIQNTLVLLSAADIRQFADRMLESVDQKHLPARELRRWIEDTVADITLD
ncbi:MAG: tetratricopeptide repeat protein, partial [Chloroflexota bacterium]|nr:tetratricopeptide repeat protein [Chloroflexota bacterium]